MSAFGTKRHCEDHCRSAGVLIYVNAKILVLLYVRIASRRPGSVAKHFSAQTYPRRSQRMPLYQREATMRGLQVFDVHRTWEDYAGIMLGVLIGLSPWLTGDEVKLLAMGNAVVVGGLVFALAAFELVDLNRSEEVGEIVLALWLIASPFILNYVESPLAIWHFVLGAVVAVLAGLELWQDWSLTERELIRHGR
jgi:hypothetical protein